MTNTQRVTQLLHVQLGVAVLLAVVVQAFGPTTPAIKVVLAGLPAAMVALVVGAQMEHLYRTSRAWWVLGGAGLLLLLGYACAANTPLSTVFISLGIAMLVCTPLLWAPTALVWAALALLVVADVLGLWPTGNLSVLISVSALPLFRLVGWVALIMVGMLGTRALLPSTDSDADPLTPVRGRGLLWGTLAAGVLAFAVRLYLFAFGGGEAIAGSSWYLSASSALGGDADTGFVDSVLAFVPLSHGWPDVAVRGAYAAGVLSMIALLGLRRLGAAVGFVAAVGSMAVSVFVLHSLLLITVADGPESGPPSATTLWVDSELPQPAEDSLLEMRAAMLSDPQWQLEDPSGIARVLAAPGQLVAAHSELTTAEIPTGSDMDPKSLPGLEDFAYQVREDLLHATSMEEVAALAEEVEEFLDTATAQAGLDNPLSDSDSSIPFDATPAQMYRALAWPSEVLTFGPVRPLWAGVDVLVVVAWVLLWWRGLRTTPLRWLGRRTASWWRTT